MKALVLSMFAVVLLLAGCGGGGQTAATTGNPEESVSAAAPAGTELKARAPKADELGKEAVCPVMKTKFKVVNSTQVFDYKGKAYFMCCAGCPGPFSKDPEKYISAK